MRERAVQTDQAERHARPAPVRVPARPAAFLALAAAIGNRAATTMVARAESGAGGAGPAPAADQDQGAEGGPGVPSFDAASASDEQRLDEIRTRLATGDTVRDIWRAFADLPATANAHADLWGPSAKRHPELARDEQVEAAFKACVEQLALEGLAASHAAVDAEIQTLGVEHEFKPDADPEHLDAVVKLQQQAALLKEALRAKNALLNMPVGWEQPPAPGDPAQVPMHGPKQLLFEPGNPPSPESVTDDPSLQPYERVMKEYEPIEAVVAQAMNNPALFAIVEGGNGQKDEGAQRLLGLYNANTPAMAQLNLGLSLHEMVEKVEQATAAVGGSLDHRDLRPLHEKVTAEAPFSQPFERAVAQQAVADHDAMKTWIALGLTIPGAVALLLPGGAALAGIVGALGSATQAGLSWADYQRIKTAREARTGPGNDLVTEKQLDDAAIQAALDAAFAFLDGVTAVRGAVRGSVAELASLAPSEREAALADAMSTMGPGKAIEAAGGIDAVRTAGAGSAGARAQAYTAGLEDALSAHLGELPAEADLLPEAQRFVANYAGVGEPHALQTLLPQYTHPEELRGLIAKAKGRQVAAWVGKTADERAAFALQDAIAKLPHPPKILLSTVLPKDTAHFDPKTWTIVVSVKSFMGDTITEGELLYLKGIGIHEAEHGIQFFESAQFHIQTSANRTAAIAELKNKGLNPAAVDAAANAAPLDAAGVQRARPHYQEFLGTRYGFYEQVEKAVIGASDRLKAAEAKHAAAQAVLRQLTDAGAHDAKTAAAAAELSAAWKEMAYEKNTIDSYLNRLEVEKGAFEAQRKYVFEQEQRYAAEALAKRTPYMDGLVVAGVLVAGAAIGGTVMYEVAIRPAQAPAHP